MGVQRESLLVTRGASGDTPLYTHSFVTPLWHVCSDTQPRSLGVEEDLSSGVFQEEDEDNMYIHTYVYVYTYLCTYIHTYT